MSTVTNVVTKKQKLDDNIMLIQFGSEGVRSCTAMGILRFRGTRDTDSLTSNGNELEKVTNKIISDCRGFIKL